MSLYDPQIYTTMNQFQSAITAMAWDIAGKAVEAERKRLIDSLEDVVIKAENRLLSPGLAKKMVFLIMNSGTWDRGRGSYRVIGPGQKPDTYDLENLATGKKINATAMTLISRWKHIP